MEDKSVLDIEEKIQIWIALRRVAGGFSRGQQQQVGGDLLPTLAEKIKSGRDEYAYEEKIRLLGALEWLDRGTKNKWGTTFVNKAVSNKATQAELWP